MKKLVALLLTLCAIIIPTLSLTGCSIMDSLLDFALDEEEFESLREENEALKEELANLKFELAFPGGIIDEDAILNSVSRSVPAGEEGDALQVIGNATVIINAGTFDGGNTPAGA